MSEEEKIGEWKDFTIKAETVYAIPPTEYQILEIENDNVSITIRESGKVEVYPKSGDSDE